MHISEQSGDQHACVGRSPRKPKLERVTQDSVNNESMNNYVRIYRKDRPSSSPFLSVLVRSLQILTLRSSPVVTSCSAWRSLISGLKAMDVTRCSPCGLLILVFNIQDPVSGFHCQIFRWTSPRKASSPPRPSMVAIHSPEEETVTCSTHEGSIGASSRREILFDGDTSNSLMRVEVEGAYVWREEGCDEGSIRVDVTECTARGEDAGRPPYTVSGSENLLGKPYLIKVTTYPILFGNMISRFSGWRH